VAKQMKKLTTKVLLLVAVVSMSLFACTKKISNEPQEKKSVQLLPNVATAAGSSSVFPLSNYDGAGVLHNEGLHYTLTTPGYSQMPFDMQMNTVTNFFTENQIEADLNLPVNEIESSLDAIVDMDASAFGGYIIAGVASQPVWQQEMSMVINVINTSSDNATADEVSGRLRAVESRILANPAISDEDKNAVLQFSSIVRHSQEYWKNFVETQQQMGRFNAGACWDCIKKNWKKLALSDGWGFITGLLKGGWQTGVVKAIAKSAGSLWKHCRQPCFW
jgi:hypothetical protein